MPFGSCFGFNAASPQPLHDDADAVLGNMSTCIDRSLL